MKVVLYLFILMGCIFPVLTSHAQKCTPYVLYRDNFGGKATSSNVGQRLPAGITTYQYQTASPVEDGGYGIRKKVTGHGGPNGSWHQMTDHTGNGYMMLVNADYDPGMFYQKTITNLCQGTSFYFSVWVANLMKAQAGGPRDPNLKFVILNPNTKAVIGDTTTGLLPRYANPTWEEYGIHFNLPTGLSSVILQIFNNAAGGNGNDLVLDDITFSICGPPLTTTVTGMYQNGSNTCNGQRVELTGILTSGGYQQPEYQWQFGSDTTQWQDIPGENKPGYLIPKAGIKDSGWYRIVVAEKGNIQQHNCRIASDAIPVHVWQPRKPVILTNSPVCEGENLFLKVPEAMQLTGRWTGPNNFTTNKTDLSFTNAMPSLSGIYSINAINPGGCQIFNKKKIFVQPNNLVHHFNQTDSIICEGDQRTLNATNPGANYLWNTGSILPKIIVDTGGLYQVNVQKGVCSISDSIRLYSLKVPKVNLGPDTSVCEGEPFYLHATYTDVKNYQWNNGSPDSVFVVTRPGRYAVTINNYCGIANDNIQIAMEPCSNELIFPTAFTPNRDGQNDIFRPRVLIRLSHYQLSIYNRWGKNVFQSADPSGGWDGTVNGNPSPTGAYVWSVRYKRIKDDKIIHQKGVITLIR